MSDGEWDLAKTAVFGVNGEVIDYGNKIASRCAVLLGAQEVSDALSCIDDAYDGVEGRVLVSVDQLDDLKSDVGKKCLKALTYAYNVLNEDLFQALSVSKEALNSLEPVVITPSLSTLRRQRLRWDDASGDMLQLCAPA